jgi:hypothetical protein
LQWNLRHGVAVPLEPRIDTDETRIAKQGLCIRA